MEDMELIFSLTVGQLREALAYFNTDDLIEEVLGDIDFGLYIEDDCVSCAPIYDCDEELDEDNLWDEGEEDYDNEEEDEAIRAMEPLEDAEQEDLAQTIAKDIVSDLYTFDVVHDAYGAQTELYNRISYLTYVYQNML